MARYWTSDLHLGHSNIIRYAGRPFADVEEMNGALIERWNDVVTHADEVWVLGDVALGRIEETLGFIEQLRGRKVLLTGNHDRCWHGHGAKAERWLKRYADAGFDKIHHGNIETTLGSTPVMCSHFPYRGDSQDHERYPHHRPIDTGAVLLHGHVHEQWKVRGRQINVGVDVWDFRPITDEQLLEVFPELS